MVENVGWALYNVLMYDAQNLSLVQAFFKNKWVRLVLVFDALLVVVLVGVMIIENTKSAMVDILTVPSVAKVRIGGGEYKSGAYKIHPGDYEAEVKADGFVTKTVPVNARDGEISKVWVYLVPEEGGFDWYTLKDNYDEFEQLARIATLGHNLTTDQDESAEEFIDVSSIMNVLPLEYFDYNEEYPEQSRNFVVYMDEKKDCPRTNGCLLVSPVTNVSHDEILDYIRASGFDPAKYVITFEEDVKL